ncbi:AI-2E family transporter [Peribacillus loiseleuriae]|uniref:AI-2E family transporter n=1 Tax=Peribacillus loiseleuriae TaxID=1679170 RepID=UPI00380EC592
MALLIFVSTKISFLFEPIVIFTTTLFFPILIAGFLYFIFNPVVIFLTNQRVPKGLAILLIFVLFVGIIAILSSLIGPALTKQITDLVNNLPEYIGQGREFFDNFLASKQYQWFLNQNYVSLDKMETSLINFVKELPSYLTTSLSSVFSVVTNITLTIVTVPFVLFYMLKDGHKFPHAIAKFIPAHYRREGITLLGETAATLSTYIQGQFLVCLFVGVATFIGYLIIDLPYAIVLALIGALTNIIPYVGPFLGAAPAVIVGLIDSPIQAGIVIIVVVIVQQLDSNLISPLVIGKKLNTHPLTIIFVLLVAGNLAGILGMILAIPTYSVIKTIVLNIVKFIRLKRRTENENPDSAPPIIE